MSYASLYNHGYGAGLNQPAGFGNFPGGVQMTAPMEAQDGGQITTQLGGYGHEGLWKEINPLNDLTGSQYPTLGIFVLAPSAGAVAGTAGPLDAEDFGVTATDAQATGQWSATANILDPAGKKFGMLVAVRFSGLPAAAQNRNIAGSDGTDDLLIQYQHTPTGRIRLATIAGTTEVSVVDANHNDGNWHLVMVFHDPVAARQKCVTDLGTSADESLSGQSQLDLTGAFFIHRNGTAAPCTVSTLGVFMSDGSTEMNTAYDNLYTNAQAAIAAYMTNTGM